MHHLALMQEARRTAFQTYIDRVQEKTGLDPAAIARRAKLAKSTIHRPYYHPETSAMPSLRTVHAIEKGTGVPWADHAEMEKRLEMAVAAVMRVALDMNADLDPDQIARITRAVYVALTEDDQVNPATVARVLVRGFPN